MPSVFHSSTRLPTRLFSRAAGALVVLLGIISAAPAFAIVGEWSTPVNLSEDGVGALEQQVAVYGAGNAIAVWVREDGNTSTSVVQSGSSSDGGMTWSTPEDLSVASQATFEPQIAVDDAGNAVAVWSRYNDSVPDPDQIVQSSWSSDGGVTWSTPEDLSAPGQDAFGQQLVIDGAGNAVAVWRRSDGSDYVVQSSWSSDDGVNWSTPEDLSAPGQDAYGLQDVYGQVVAVDGAGNAVAVWSSSDGSDYVVQSSRSSDDGVNWSTPEDLSAPGQDAYDPQVAVNDAGNAVATWRRYDGSNAVVQFSRSSDGGVNWSTPVTLSVAGRDAYGGQAAINDAGNAVAVWRRYNGSNYVVQASGSLDGGVNWSTPVTLSVAGADVSGMQVAVDGSGNAVAAWARFTGINTVQSSGSSDGGVSWSAPVNLSRSGQDADNPQVAANDAANPVPGQVADNPKVANGSGNAVAVWRRYNGSHYVVQSSGSSDVGSGGEELADTGAGGLVNNTALVASVGLLALGVLTRVFVRRRGVENGR